MNEKQNFNKITHFITDSYNNLPNQGVIIVKSVNSGFKVNNIDVKQRDNIWHVEKDKIKISEFRQKRVAIIFAALLCKNRYFDSAKMIGIDRQLDICLEDKNNYNIRIKKSNNKVFFDRLSRTEKELEFIEQELKDLEKSLSLQ